MGKLSDAKIRDLKAPGDYPDGPGAYGLMVKVKDGSHRVSRTFIQRITWKGKPTHLGLGVHDEDLLIDDARAIALQNHALIAKGVHPRRQDTFTIPTFSKALTLMLTTFGEYATDRDRERYGQWKGLAQRFINPVIGDMQVDQIMTRHVRDVLMTTWGTDIHKTSERVQYLVGKVMRWAVGEGYRANNPVDGRLLRDMLPRVRVRTRHMRSVPFENYGVALEAVLTKRGEVATRLLAAFVMMTACRTKEARFATWAEFDLEKGVWTIPEEHTKMGREHRVPLCRLTLEILRRARQLHPGDGLVFPSSRDPSRPMAGGTPLSLLTRMGIDGTMHGCRASYRTFGAEHSVPEEYGRAALAHVKTDSVDEAYRRTDFLEHRREVMETWSDYVESQMSGDLTQTFASIDLRLRARETCARIRGRRIEWGRSLKGLASLLGLSLSTIVRGDSGHVIRSDEALAKIEEWLAQPVPAPDPAHLNLGPRLREARMTRQVTRPQLAGQLGISTEPIERLETGRGGVSDRSLELLVAWLADDIPEDLLRLRDERLRLGGQLPKLIRAKRIEWEMDYVGAGEYLGVGGGTVSSWERGLSPVSDRKLPAVLAWLEAPLSDRPAGLSRHDRKATLLKDRLAEARPIIARVERERIRLRLTKQELAEMIEVELSAIGKWERGVFAPSPANLAKLVRWVEAAEKLPTPEAVGLRETARRAKVAGVIKRVDRECSRLGMTRVELAGKLGIPAATLYNWLRGRYTPPTSSLRILVRWVEEAESLPVPARIVSRRKALREARNAEVRPIVRRLECARRRMGLSISALARTLGVPHTTLSSWVKEISMPRTESVVTIGRWLERVESDEVEIIDGWYWTGKGYLSADSPAGLHSVAAD